MVSLRRLSEIVLGGNLSFANFSFFETVRSLITHDCSSVIINPASIFVRSLNSSIFRHVTSRPFINILRVPLEKSFTSCG